MMNFLQAMDKFSFQLIVVIVRMLGLPIIKYSIPRIPQRAVVLVSPTMEDKTVAEETGERVKSE